MNRGRLAAVARKEFIHVFRDSRSLAMGIAIPVLLLLLFGYGLSLNVDNVPLVIEDSDGSTESRNLIRSFTASAAFSEAGYSMSPEETREMLQNGEATAVLVIPQDYSRRLNRGEQANVQFLVDGSDSNTARMAMAYARGITAGSAAGRISTVTAYNPSMDTTWSIIPGLIAIIVNVIAAMLTSLCVAREWENGTMEQLISTPVRKAEFIAGKLIPYYAIGVLDIVTAVSMAVFLFGIPLGGSLFLLAAVCGVFLLGALSLGVLISIAARTQLLASQLSLIVTFLPGFILSGFVYDIRSMPPVVQGVTRLIPARYFVTLLRSVFLKGVWGMAHSVELGILALFAVVVLFISMKKLRFSLDGDR